MGEMIAGVAHQWNEPLVELSAIMQDMEFCFNTGEMDSQKMKEFVKDSIIQIQYMSQTLKDFRNFFKTIQKESLLCKKSIRRCFRNYRSANFFMPISILQHIILKKKGYSQFMVMKMSLNKFYSISLTMQKIKL